METLKVELTGKAPSAYTLAEIVDRLEGLASLDPEDCYDGVNKLLVELRDGKSAPKATGVSEDRVVGN